MATPDLLRSIHNNRIDKLILESVYNNNLKSIYDKVIEKSGTKAVETKFDPYKHLKYYADEKEKEKFHSTRRLSMEDLRRSHPDQITEIGVTDPFPLFTDEAISLMRYSYRSTSGLDAGLRGYVKNMDTINCPFIHSAWNHPLTIDLISKMADVELEIIYDYETAVVNISMKSEEQAAEERIKFAREQSLSGVSNGEDIPAVVGWHYDSPPLVCVLMLSDTTNMIGGETCLRKGLREGETTEEVIPVPGPSRGNACVLQGRFIEHIAPKPLGSSERMTMVTSFRPKNPLTVETSVLSTVKPEINWGSRYSDYYAEWIDYRSEIIKKRLDHLNSTIRARRADHKFDKEAVMDNLKEISKYLSKTYEEMEVTDEEWEQIIQNNNRK
ncbi:hypothetical protein HYPBUDRAFT_157460 [Hyphopichia burtonii NRRL Y-1933]|uniref:Fe2OG dioxygenase domain-containing protein n=1 Tax=Hyphopichia burtonii NRRL Y-1933 TaxID=984485 RepID=A0A1E4RG72_9ASCO|nr:hypothetical protein HYPBUDRAFT_157460 [Hyphopichia burtonii NRRL Y-1933]ODV66267.1 hypothetical protein HYPBUDRAFT_157460 [Hyphopichia burtonii NRRL Y-1933]